MRRFFIDALQRTTTKLYYDISESFYPGTILSLATTALLFALSARTATAQGAFERDYGSTTCSEIGFRGVEPVNIQSGCSGGGYIAVGSTDQTGSLTSCGQKNVYLVRTDATGARIWEYHYDIGGYRRDDIGFSVKEVADGFVVAGTTKEPNNINTDIFLLKVDCNGVLVWATIYGRSIMDDEGRDVIIAANGNGGTTNPGDIIVAGWTHNRNKSTNRDALLFRTNSTGGLIWSASYDGVNPGSAGRDFFTAVTETSVVGPGFPAGNVVAVGGTTSYTLLPAAWAVRVDANTGVMLMGGVYGGADQETVFNGVTELTTGAEAGNLVYVGASKGFYSPANSDLYVVKSGQNPCSSLVERSFGDLVGLNQDDSAHDVIECRSQPSPGDVYITGMTHNGQPGSDVFLLQLAPANLGFTSGHVYGDHAGRNDIGFSLMDDFIEPTPGIRQFTGIVMCGLITRPGSPNDPDLYLLKTNTAGETGCQDPWNPLQRDTPWFQTCMLAEAIDDYEWSQAGLTTRRSVDWGHLLCSLLPRTNPSSSDALDENAAIDAITSYPNPVASGKELGVDFTSNDADEIRITVTTIAGEQIAAMTKPAGAGRLAFSVPTEGWAAGIYLVRVDDGERAETVRVVVTE